MYDSGRVNILQAPEQLVNEELYMVVRKSLCFDNRVEVSSHQFGDEVQVREMLQVVGVCEHV